MGKDLRRQYDLSAILPVNYPIAKVCDFERWPEDKLVPKSENQNGSPAMGDAAQLERTVSRMLQVYRPTPNVGVIPDCDALLIVFINSDEVWAMRRFELENLPPKGCDFVVANAGPVRHSE